MKLKLNSFKTLIFPVALFYVSTPVAKAQTATIDLTLSPTNNDNYYYTNSIAVIGVTTDYGLRVHATGAPGAWQNNKDGYDGGVAGTISNFYNALNTPISLSILNPTGFKAAGILLDLRGGDGGNYTNDDGDHNAGFGGITGSIKVDNAGPISATGTYMNGLALFEARTQGGNGGAVTPKKYKWGVPEFNDHEKNGVITPLGRPGASAGQITLANDGDLNAGTSTVPLIGAGTFEGARATTQGGNAGLGLLGSAGGNAGAISLTSSDDIQIFLKSSSATNAVTKAYGLLAQASGGNGTDSYRTGHPGGNGGAAGEVNVSATSSNEITLSHDGSNAGSTVTEGAAIGAFSTGGNAGNAWNGDSNSQGNSGTGGLAGPVNILLQDTNVNVLGNRLGGIQAVSTGGIGGNGTDNQKSYGGPGGNAGSVTVNFNTLYTTQSTVTLSTNGNDAVGIAASSLGGDGGFSPISHQDLGGTSGDGGYGGSVQKVTVNLTGNVLAQTGGSRSHGISTFSQGGNGGYSGGLSTTFVGTGDGSGRGGAGASGGPIEIILANGAKVLTSGDDSHGILALTQGGAGGNGGKVQDDAFGDGGPGGNGGNGGTVSVSVDAKSTVQTAGSTSHAVMAQSQSGSGGIGGLSSSTISGTSGKGGAAGNSGIITVDNAGRLITAGSDSYGILAQGTSGGGGGSGSSSSVIYSSTGAPGASGAVGDLNITNRGAIITSGLSSYGVLAQSFSGNGGASGRTELGVFSSPAPGGPASSGGKINFNQSGSISTTGNQAHAVQLQSTGGGGGDGGSATGLVAVGGNSGSGGNGGNLNTVHSTGTLSTTGENAHAIYATSVGGRGGNGGNSKSLGVGVALTIGGTGGAGGIGGTVDVLSSGYIATANSKANGILAQSIGGGGGNGGAALSLAVSPVISVAVAVGGSGSDGQRAGNTKVTQSGGSIWTGQNSSSVSTPTNTLPSDAIGILAQSIGGGGGNGGVSSASAVAIALPIPVPEVPQVALGISSSVGGKGGRGGNGGLSEIFFDQGSQLITQGQGSHGALSQSIGGGGGNGGDSSAAAATIGYSRIGEMTEQINIALNVAVALGGSAGSGGLGGTSNITFGGVGAASNLATFGDFSNGLVAHSIGGGGGNAGFGSATTRAYGSATNLNLSVGLGGDGGSGGNGGVASGILNAGSTISTFGAGAHGLVLQSVGGGGGISQGGAVGLSAEKAFPLRSEVPSEIPGGEPERPRGSLVVGAKLELELGATSGSGGDGGAASAVINSQILTHGNDSTGVIIQSIGGGGGLAGGGGSEASHDAEEAPEIEGEEEDFNLSSWLSGYDPIESMKFARADITKLVFKEIPTEFEVKLSLGSFDSGESGRGGNVTLSGNGSIATDGDWSHGILAQSIGGGGGKADSAVPEESEAIMELGFNVGGLGKRLLNPEIGEKTESNTATGASGGEVIANWDGLTVSTGTAGNGKGFSAIGIILQSIGGGGGIGVDGSALAKGNINVGNSATGEADGNVTGDGDLVHAFGSAKITTSGIAAHGLVAQSIGGGGGIGGAGSNIEVVDENENAINSEIDVRVGGNPYSTGRGGQVFLGNDAEFLNLGIRTTGHSAYGILAQSIGGGGGLAAVMDPRNSGTTGTESGSGGTTRNSGRTVNIELGSDTRISTSGMGAHGIVAQSIGAGGGIAGYGSDAAFRVSPPTGSLYAYGDAGEVMVFLAAGSTLTTTGTRAHGILTQSIGGEGGLYAGLAGRANALGTGSGDNILVNVIGNLAVTGEDSYGIFTQTDGATQDATKGSQLRISGNVSSAGTAVYLSGGRNVVNIFAGGSVKGINALESVSSQAPVINNAGVWEGSLLHNGISIATPTSSLARSASAAPLLAQFNNTGTAYLGSRIEANVANTGRIHLGLDSTNQTTITGSLIQSSGGTLIINGEDRSQSQALLTVLGETDIKGFIQPIVSKIKARHDVKIMTVASPLEHNATLDLSQAGAASNIFTLGLRQDGQDLYLSTVAADFSPTSSDLSKNSVNVADHLEDIWKRGSSPSLDTFFENLDTLALSSSAAYDQALLEISPGASLGFAAQALGNQHSFITSTLDSQKFVGDSTNPTATQSLWARSSGGHSSRDVAGQSVHDSTTNSFVNEVGAQWAICRGLLIGGTFGFQHDDLRSETNHVNGDGQSAMAALSARYEQHDWLFAAALSGSTGSFDTTRRIAIQGYEAELESSPGVQSLGFLLRAAYTFHNAQAYLRPRLDAGFIHVHADSLSESGSSLLRLDLKENQQTSLIITPGLEVGLRTNLDNGMILRHYANCSVSFLSSDDWEQQARFNTTSGGAGSFTTSLPQDQVSGSVVAGVQLQFTETLSGYLQYEGSFAENTVTNGGGIGLQFNF